MSLALWDSMTRFVLFSKYMKHILCISAAASASLLTFGTYSGPQVKKFSNPGVE